MVVHMNSKVKLFFNTTYASSYVGHIEAKKKQKKKKLNKQKNNKKIASSGTQKLAIALLFCIEPNSLLS